MSFLDKQSKIFIAGHRGMVGSAVFKKLKEAGFVNIVTKARNELDLLNQDLVYSFLKKEKPDLVIDAAAKVGGIVSNNTYRADFIYQNLTIQNNLIWGSHLANIQRLIFLGSSCIFPKECPQPIKEEYLLTSILEETNRPYALAKICGLELIDCLNKQYGRRYLSLMPCNLYGPGDNYDPENSHVIPGLIRKFMKAVMSEASEIEIWGSGNPKREFLHSYDLAKAVVKVVQSSDDFILELDPHRSFLNVGSGSEVSIRELAEKISKIFNYRGKILFNSSKPDGTMRKVLDSTRFRKSGWKAEMDLEKGLIDVIEEQRLLLKL
ncbi:MAG: GDP-L-fucose synthase [Chryseobacterium sp.]